MGPVPYKKRAQRICAGISELTRRSQTQQDAETLVADLNRRLIGWANYFCPGPVSKAYRAVEVHTRRRLRQWLCAKHQLQGQGIRRYPAATLHEGLGLVRLTWRAGGFPFLREPDASMRASGSMSGVWKRSNPRVTRIPTPNPAKRKQPQGGEP